MANDNSVVVKVGEKVFIKGDQGAVFIPAVDEQGNISWTNDGGLPNPTTRNIIGPEGEKGDTPDFSIGTVTTGDPGSPAAASITGTPENPVLNLTIPKGNTGEVTQAEFDELAGEVADQKSAISGLPNLEKTVNGYTVRNYTSGKGLNSSGEVVDNADRCVSDKIPYTWEGATRYYCGDNTTDTYNICFFNASDVLIQRYKSPSNTGGAVYRHVTAPEGTSYVRFDFKKNYTGYASANVTSDTPVYWIAATTEVDGLSDKV